MQDAASGDRASTEPVLLSLSGRQDVRVASELQQQLIEILTPGRPVVLDCSETDSLDVAALQLLLAARRESSSALEIRAPADGEAASSFQLAGVADALLVAGDES